MRYWRRSIFVGIPLVFAAAADAGILVTSGTARVDANWLYGYDADVRTHTDYDEVSGLPTNPIGDHALIVDTIHDTGNWFGHAWDADAQYGSSQYLAPFYSTYPTELAAFAAWGSAHATTTSGGGALTQLEGTGHLQVEFGVSGYLGGPTPVQLQFTMSESGPQADVTTRLDWLGPFGWQALGIWSSASTTSIDQTFYLDAGQSYRLDVATWARDVGNSPSEVIFNGGIIDTTAPEPTAISTLLAGLWLATTRTRKAKRDTTFPG